MSKDKKSCRFQIGLIGDSVIQSKKQYDICMEIGEEIARNNQILICGGRGGVMEAASKGVFQEKGISIGILPTDLTDSEINPYLSVRIPTMLGWSRNAIIPLASDVLIVCGGAMGTLSEISFTWLYNKPMICIMGVGGWSQEIGSNLNFYKAKTNSIIRITNSGKEAVKLALGILETELTFKKG